MARKPKSDPPIVWNGPADLRPQLVPIVLLREDEYNANTHSELSISDIAGSYARFGQQRPVVVDKTGAVRAGNGQLQAARKLGWTHLAAVTSDLDGIELSLFALADNQTPKRAVLDYEIVRATLHDAAELGLPVDDLGWQPSELTPLMAMDWIPPAITESGPVSDGTQIPMGRPLLLTAEQRVTVDAAVARMREMTPTVETSEGMVIDFVCGDWLSGAGHPGEPVPWTVEKPGDGE